MISLILLFPTKAGPGERVGGGGGGGLFTSLNMAAR